MNEYFQVVKDQLYTPFILYAIVLACACIGFARWNKHPALKLFPFYAIGYLIGDPVLFLLNITGSLGHAGKTIALNYENLFTLFEFLVYSLFFYPFLTNREKKAYALLFILYTGFFLMLTLWDNFGSSLERPDVSMLYTVQGALLLLLVIFYYINLFRNPAVKKVNKLPAIWIATGLAFLQAVLLPLSFFESYVFARLGRNAVLLFSFYNIFYMVNFLMIIRAFLCKPTNPS